MIISTIARIVLISHLCPIEKVETTFFRSEVILQKWKMEIFAVISGSYNYKKVLRYGFHLLCEKEE